MMILDEAIKIAKSYGGIFTPTEAVDAILHDISEQFGDAMRGRGAFADWDNWYDAYMILCFRAGLKPQSKPAIRYGDYERDHELLGF